jgi:chromosome segregation ATPase
MLGILLTGLIIPAAVVGYMFFLVSQRKGQIRKSLSVLENEFEQKAGLRDQLKSIYVEMVGVLELSGGVSEIKSLQESLKAERGRITITQTELETVETRLCELEEIERELEASNLETKEELKILQKKQAELVRKNDQLKGQIASSVQELEKVLGELNLTTAMQEQIERMKAEMVLTEQKTEILVVQISEINETYVGMKMRYDALDIEYAQLYEKFSDAEAVMQAQQSG